jgi:hypothetical protein
MPPSSGVRKSHLPSRAKKTGDIKISSLRAKLLNKNPTADPTPLSPTAPPKAPKKEEEVEIISNCGTHRKNNMSLGNQCVKVLNQQNSTLLSIKSPQDQQILHKRSQSKQALEMVAKPAELPKPLVHEEPEHFKMDGCGSASISYFQDHLPHAMMEDSSADNLRLPTPKHNMSQSDSFAAVDTE